MSNDLPLSGLVVLDFAQFLAGPLASLRLGDLGARVIKIERPKTGDVCRHLYITDVVIDGDSTPFHVINRNKESFTADLKNPNDLARVKRLVQRADVMIENFRPGVMRRLGLDYDIARQLNPSIVYGRITGYGDTGPWTHLPGQDLLAQARSGACWLTGDADSGPTPYGLALADMLAGNILAEGLLACLVRRGRTGRGGLVETSLLEALLDLQFEVLPTYLADDRRPPKRSGVYNAHAYISAPYGVYPTADGYLALAMCDLVQLGELLEIEALKQPEVRDEAFSRRDEIKRLVADRLLISTTGDWLGILQPADVWCAEVLDWERLLDHDAFKALDIFQQVQRSSGVSLTTLRGPFRIDGRTTTHAAASPYLGEHTDKITAEFNLADPTDQSLGEKS